MNQIAELEKLLKELREKSKGGIYELRYSPSSFSDEWHWILMEIKYPNRPEAVHGTIASSPIESVKVAIKYWDELSEPWVYD
jgi:hypothetical protein